MRGIERQYLRKRKMGRNRRRQREGGIEKQADRQKE